MIDYIQDLSTDAACTLDATNWATLKTNNKLVVAGTISGVDSTKEFLKVKFSFNSLEEFAKLSRNNVNKYSGLFFVEETIEGTTADVTSFYEIHVHYDGARFVFTCNKLSEYEEEKDTNFILLNGDYMVTRDGQLFDIITNN